MEIQEDIFESTEIRPVPILSNYLANIHIQQNVLWARVHRMVNLLEAESPHEVLILIGMHLETQ